MNCAEILEGQRNLFNGARRETLASEIEQLRRRSEQIGSADRWLGRATHRDREPTANRRGTIWRSKRRGSARAQELDLGGTASRSCSAKRRSFWAPWARLTPQIAQAEGQLIEIELVILQRLRGTPRGGDHGVARNPCHRRGVGRARRARCHAAHGPDGRAGPCVGRGLRVDRSLARNPLCAPLTR